MAAIFAARPPDGRPGSDKEGQLVSPALTPISELIGTTPPAHFRDIPVQSIEGEWETVSRKRPRSGHYNSPRLVGSAIRSTPPPSFENRRPTSVVGDDTAAPQENGSASAPLVPADTFGQLKPEANVNAVGLSNRGSANQPSLFTPPPEPTDVPLLNITGDSSPLIPPLSTVSATSSSTSGLQRPSHAPRSATSPLLKRRESVSAPRNPKAPLESSKAARPNLPPLKLGEDSRREANASARPSVPKEGIASPMPSAIPLPPLSLATYLQLELSSDRPSALYMYRPISSEFQYESAKIKFDRLLNFLRLPLQLEQALWFGALACLDAWLYCLTILPLRFLKALAILAKWSIMSVLVEFRDLLLFVPSGIGRVWRRGKRGLPLLGKDPISRSALAPQVSPDTSATGRSPTTPTARSRASRRTPSALSPGHKADLLQGLLIVVSFLLLNKYDASRMYHSIRGQAAIKLYVIYNVLEVCDRLLSALGQDVLECLFSKETLERRPDGRSKILRPVWMFFLALLYNVTHATLLFYQVVTLNVAVNSYSNALLTLLMSNQFVEIKGTVFKKFEKENLFQLTCADVVERFQLWLMLSIIASRNIVEVGGLSQALSGGPSKPPTNTAYTPNSTATPPASSSSLLPAAFSLLPSLTSPVLAPFFIVLGSEMLVDWLKHAYINKFNSIKPSLYGRFLDILAKDYYAHAFADQNLTKRLGLPTLPLVCLVLRAGVQVWAMFVATTSMASPIAHTQPRSSSTSVAPLTSGSPGLLNSLALPNILARVREHIPLPELRGWTWNDVLRLCTITLFVLLLYLFLLAFKLVLGMALLGFARNRYRSMKEREVAGYDTGSRRVGGWGVTEVDEDKRRWIYGGDEEGLRKLREREGRDKERRRDPDAGLKLEGVRRYTMAAKRIW